MKNSNSRNMDALDASKDEAGITIDASQVVAASAQVIVTGTSTGNLKFQFSNDTSVQCTTDAKGKLQPTNWTDIASQTVAVAGAGVVAIPKFDCCYQFLRTFFVQTNAQSGTITVEVNTKGF